MGGLEFVHRFSQNQLLLGVVQIRIDGHGAFASSVANLCHAELSSNATLRTDLISEMRRDGSHAIGEYVTVSFDVIDDFRLLGRDLDRVERRRRLSNVWGVFLLGSTSSFVQLTRIVASELVKH